MKTEIHPAPSCVVPEVPLQEKKPDLQIRQQLPEIPILPQGQVAKQERSATAKIGDDYELSTADIQEWQNKTLYSPWLSDENEEDLRREVRRDRIIPRDNDPMLDHILEMFPDAGSK